MSLSSSQSSKGCESGWTVYLNESLSHFPEEANRGGSKAKADDDDEEENLSMVSDASSGPPFHEVEDECSNVSCSMGKRRSKSKSKKKAAKGEQYHQQQHLSHYYEDTACSPHLKCTEEDKTESQNFHHYKNSASAPAEKANSGRIGGLKNRKRA